MSNILIFRGKSATGKTSLTDLISRETGISILRKDDIYDELHKIYLDHSEINKVSYEIMAKIIQTNINTNSSLIIDVALIHLSHIELFLSKVDWSKTTKYHFLCTCSDEKEWEQRLLRRFKNPLPNQVSIFNNIDDAHEYYKNYDMSLLQGEIELDSAKDINCLKEMVLKKL